MVSLMLVAENERESQILKIAFEQRGISVLPSKAEYQNYIKTLQYTPDIIFIEMPPMHMQQIHFAELIKNHKKIRRIPVIAYGNIMDNVEKNGILKVGVHCYFERPLKFTQIIKLVETLLKQFNKALDVKPPVLDKEKDIELLLSSSTLPLKKIDIITSYVSSLLAFPFTVTKVLSLADSEKAAASDLARVIEADPVLSTQILKLSNSVLFASLNRRISTIKDAIVRIGFKETKRLVMSMSVMQLFDAQNKNCGFDRIGFWYHSLACGVIGERLARRIGNINSDEVFLAGLLHDFGVIIFDEFFPTIFSKILEDTANAAGLFFNREKLMLGIHHNEVMKELFTKWKLPDMVGGGIFLHYDVDSFKDTIDSPEQKTAIIIHLGNILAKATNLGKECDQFISPIPNEFLACVKLQTGFTQTFLDDIYHELNVYREFLKLDVAKNTNSKETTTSSEKAKIGFVNMTNETFIPPLLYLQKEGYKVVTLTMESDLKKQDLIFDIIVIWGTSDIIQDKIEIFSHIIKFAEPPPSPTLAPVFAPILTLIPLACANSFSQKNLGQFSFAYNSLDLRQIDNYISSIVLGTPISLSDCNSSIQTIAKIEDKQTENEIAQSELLTSDASSGIAPPTNVQV